MYHTPVNQKSKYLSPYGKSPWEPTVHTIVFHGGPWCTLLETVGNLTGTHGVVRGVCFSWDPPASRGKTPRGKSRDRNSRMMPKILYTYIWGNLRLTTGSGAT